MQYERPKKRVRNCERQYEDVISEDLYCINNVYYHFPNEF